MERFLVWGFFGYYKNVFARTVYLYKKKEKSLINYFTIITAIEDQNEYEIKNIQFGNLNSEYAYGLYQRIESLDWLRNTYNELQTKKTFTDNLKSILVGDLNLIQEQLVTHSLSGSLANLTLAKYAAYTYEFFDINKRLLSPILDNHNLIETINQNLLENNLDLSKNQERIGNIIFEFPNNLITSFERPNGKDILINWDQRFIDTSNVKILFSRETKTINHYSIENLQNNYIIFSERIKLQRFKLISLTRNIVLLDGHNCPEIGLSISKYEILPVKRKLKNGNQIEISQIPSMAETGNSIDSVQACILEFENRKNVIKNINELKYKQYGLNSRNKSRSERHSEAMSDIHYLIRKYGEKGVYIWDPYLSGSDLIETIIYNYPTTAFVKALGSKKVYTNLDGDDETKNGHNKRKNWFTEQIQLIKDSSDLYGLNLEFRCAHSSYMASFHDRFIIFPDLGVQKICRVWSLGISLNQFGAEHHVLQEVDFPEYILNAFETYWNCFDKSEHLVFKTEYSNKNVDKLLSK